MTCVRAATGLLILTSLVACGPSRGSGDEQSDGASESGDASEVSDMATAEGDCRLAIRIDLCCNQPYAATVAAIEDEPCVVEWPIDWESLPAALVDACTNAQPDWCEVVDCNYAEPASEVVGPDGEGGCRYVCPDETYLAYRQPGCDQPIVECLGVPPPCADEYCSCAGETIYGCGQVDEPFDHVGACE